MTALRTCARSWVPWHPTSLTAGAAGLVVAALVVRMWVAASGNFYWDDLILAGRAGTYSAFAPDLLFYDHDGHFMPAAFLLAKLVTVMSPYDWTLAAATLVLLQALAALAVWRLLRLLQGDRTFILAPLAFYLFAPLSLPSYSWWAAGLNSLPLQIGLAWVAGDALQLSRTGRRRYLLSGLAVFAVALLFFEKSVLIPFVAFAVVALVAYVGGESSPIETSWRTAKPLWIGAAGITGVWLVAYLVVVDQPFTVASGSMALGLIERGFSHGIVVTLIGGPWTWERWQPSPPWADPSVPLIVLGWIAVVGAIVLVLRRKRRVLPVLACVIAYVSVSQVAMVLTRSGPDTSYELAQTLRYVADSAVIIAIGVAVVALAPDRGLLRPVPRPVLPALVVAFVASSLWSTYTFVDSWRDNPTADYLATARASLAEHSAVPMLDLPVPTDMLLPVVYPNNLASRVFAPLPDRPSFATSTPTLQSIDNKGTVVSADVSPTRAITQGPTSQCGYRIEGSTVAQLPLDGPLADWEWTAQINYAASTDGVLAVGLDNGTDVEVPVRRGLHQVFVRMVGAGDALRVYPTSPGLSVCIGAGPVGGVLPNLP